jgi:PAS domain S-box-containing protein
MVGYTREELIGRVGYEVLFDEPERQLIQEKNRRRTEGLSEAYELQMRARSGVPIWVRISAAPITGSDGQVIGSFGVIADLTAHKETEEALRASEERFRILSDASLEGIVIHESGRILECNSAFARMFGLDRDEAAGTLLLDLVDAGSAEVLDQRMRDLTSEPFELAVRTRTGQNLVLEVVGSPFPYRGRVACVAALRDITLRRHLEERLVESQKMEAVGRLAGGIAHDFNNLLTAILGYANVLASELPEGPLRRDVEEIRAAGNRAATLTRQLLAFSRRQILAPTILDLNGVVAPMENMLSRLIGEQIELVTRIEENLWPVRADAGQLSQVILNLVVNARDAMIEGGRLVLETRNAVVSEPRAWRHLSVPPGEYAVLSVRDSGVGIDEETKAHLFEPFFTTKEKGKGTGLGLATVYGIVRQSGGYVWVESAPGAGATFEVFLPRERERPAAPAPPAAPTAPAAGTETILLVEDEDAVRALAQRILERKGYRVLACRNGEAALERVGQDASAIDLVVTDLVMPGMSGRELAMKFLARRPGTPVLYMSGYTDDLEIRHHRVAGGAAFLQKPFTPDAFLLKVRELLDGRRSDRRPSAD